MKHYYCTNAHRGTYYYRMNFSIPTMKTFLGISRLQSRCLCKQDYLYVFPFNKDEQLIIKLGQGEDQENIDLLRKK